MKQRDAMKQAALGSSLTQPAGQRIRPDAKSIDESAFKVLLVRSDLLPGAFA